MRMNKIFDAVVEFINGKIFLYSLLTTLTAFFVYIVALSETTISIGDGLCHYRIARYGWFHPKLFFDHWGKPFFTLLTFPFAQFGFLGMKIFNVIGGILSAFFAYKIARELKMSNALLVIFFTLFAPIYIHLMNSALTEVLLGLFIVLTVYLFLKEKYLLSTILFSFMPFIRNEAIIFFPLIIVFLIINRKSKILPFLLTGFVLYSIAGYFVLGDILWVINKMPYTGASQVYGSGTFMHFMNKTKSIFGIPVTILAVVGMIIMAVSLRKRYRNIQYYNEVLLILFPALGYYFAHTVVWWLGIGSSGGNTKVMASIAPLIAILALKGFNGIDKILNFNKWFKTVYVLALIYAVVITPFVVYRFPMPLGKKHGLVKEAALWLKKSEYFDNKIYYHDAQFYFFTELNPYDTARIQQCVPNRKNPEINMEDSSIVIWDAHLAPNEGRLALDSLMDNKHFKLIKYFKPEHNFKVLGGYDYEIYFFQKIDPGNSRENYVIKDSLIKADYPEKDKK